MKIAEWIEEEVERLKWKKDVSSPPTLTTATYHSPPAIVIPVKTGI